MLVLRVLVVVQEVGHAPTSTIQPAIVPLLMALGVHAKFRIKVRSSRECVTF